MLIYNTLTRSKEEFKPLDGKTVKIYACGPTPYDYSHLGHARVFTIWDFIQRYLRFKGYAVTFVRNITDIDDKIINKAKALGVTPELVARRFTYEFWRDMDSLNIQPPDYEPRATEYISQIITFIEGLIASGHAYAAEGDVYFHVPSLKEYGQLCRQNLNELMSGAREQVRSQSSLEKRKKHASDFALWKGIEAGDEYRNFGWQSPWGLGRPGWHIECSTMVKDVLGETIDLHGGGEDLLFPHHENELAQSTALHKKPLARFWVHNSFVQVDSEKMSKSLGNFNTIRDLLKQFSADEIRLFILQTHYRNPIDFAPDSLHACKTAIQRLIRAVECLKDGLKDANTNAENGNSTNISEKFAIPAKPIALPLDYLQEFHEQFCAAMDNDFNTAVAIASLFNLADTIAKTTDKDEKQKAARVLLYYATLLGLQLTDNRQNISTETSKDLMALLLQLRTEAKSKKDYATADAIRVALTEYGINVMDSKEGSTWEIATAQAETAQKK